MAVTDFQRTVCRLLAAQRVRSGDSYVAGGSALGDATRSSRLSRDIDLFHDTVEAVGRSWDVDRELLAAEAYSVDVVRERPSFVEAMVSRAGDRVLVQWAADSAYRFYPLVEHADFGLTLHPFDLATNKVLALVGRVEARDWVDVLAAHEHIQAFGLLAWAACGKDPGFGPSSIVEQAARSSRYTEDEIALLEFDGPPPSASRLSQQWHAAIDDARQIVAVLPGEYAGRCVTSADGALWSGEVEALRAAVANGRLHYRTGSLRGVLPTVSTASE